jgi:hypothetical protein
LTCPGNSLVHACLLFTASSAIHARRGGFLRSSTTIPGGIMNRLKSVVHSAALLVLMICVYAFLLGNGVFEGKFENDAIAWYFLAKGIFCSLALCLSVRVITLISERLPPRD